MIFDVWEQKKPKHIKGTDDWKANLQIAGQVEADDGIEAIKIAKRRRLARWPIVSEYRSVQ